MTDHKITWQFVEESMFPLTVTDCRRAGMSTDGWAMGQPENSGRALMLVDPSTGARSVLMRFSTPADADRFFQGMRFVAARLTVPDVHPLDTAPDAPGSVFTLTVSTTGAAFHDPVEQDVPVPGPELARILRTTADRVEGAPPGSRRHVRDVNGNVVGQWEHTTGE